MGDSDVVIRVEGLGKKYSLHHEQSERYTALRDVVSRQAKAAGQLLNPFTLVGQLRKAQRQPAQEHAASEEEFWALKDVSFEIRRGERVGIIGRNGAGKSTLLKILSRIIEPTTGRVEIRGRVASLLEVGTGFHPELTGRENIYLNGAILGMTRREIRRKFDEIVDFAEVAKFLDTPVKRYSSGMYVRLAFAVAAHLEPEILVVDEVLAVGDSTFQEKCVGRMKKVSNEGRTVLFVSHQITSINILTQKCALLDRGFLSAYGRTSTITSKYLCQSPSGAEDYSCKSDRYPYISSVRLKTSLSNHIQEAGKPLFVYVRLEFDTPIPQACFSIHIFNQFGMAVMHLTQYDNLTSIGTRKGSCEIVFAIPCCRLNVGRYRLTCYLSDPPGGKQYDYLHDICEFTVDVLNQNTLFGWRPEACTYLEEYSCSSKIL